MKNRSQSDKNILSIDPLISYAAPVFNISDITIENNDVMKCYDRWESPVVIISDGPYGVASFPGDPPTPDELPKWYEPHIKAWSEVSTPMTTLWFWNTEIGWANVHPILEKYGWEYRACNIWDKGIAHIAGNSNTKNLRQYPIVTEVCVQYVKKATFNVKGKEMEMKDWLRHEWKRTKLPFNKTNEACGVKNAASRKYFTKDHLWYYPPVDAFVKLVEYANEYGDPSGRPYFSIDGENSLSGSEWSKMRAKFYCEAGITNVWRKNALRGEERLKNGSKCIHINQKPLEFTERIIKASSDPGDVVWEPFGGLCSGALAAHKLGRTCRCAEIINEFWEIAVARMIDYDSRNTDKTTTVA